MKIYRTINRKFFEMGYVCATAEKVSVLFRNVWIFARIISCFSEIFCGNFLELVNKCRVFGCLNFSER